MIQTDCKTEIELLYRRQMVEHAGVEKLPGAEAFWIVADIFGEDARLVCQLLLNDEGRLSYPLGCEVKGAKELGPLRPQPSRSSHEHGNCR